ncbi:dehydrogenase/reductase SDR family protein 7-like [Microplitis mediator]|uniref:dehydrogenase/reductase SDR family protein 7-like n=1 Tax=Microplitis mediator TaxID=375433 RepID=UPI00255467F1|nr:dehydrogenase/reductase SDR family protein 7-like [Microplitis mediator]
MKEWTFIWRLLTVYGIPLTFPWMIYYAFDFIRRKTGKISLKGKVVMITGASSGLGEALAHVFYASGCKVILVARRHEELKRVKNSLIQTAVNKTVETYPPTILSLDLTKFDVLTEEVDKILASFGQIDILVNNAGISYRGKAAKTKIDVDMQVMMINYFAQIALAKAVIPSMIKQQFGHIVCISSVQGKIAIPYRSAYAASKHALQAWCDSTRAELNNFNIKVSVVSPGYINTSLSLNAITEGGECHGKMDKATESGYSAKYVADEILTAVLRQERETIIAPTLIKFVCLIRYLIPSVYFKIMNIRAKKSNDEK